MTARMDVDRPQTAVVVLSDGRIIRRRSLHPTMGLAVAMFETPMDRCEAKLRYLHRAAHGSVDTRAPASFAVTDFGGGVSA
jgi:hypothetical protein